MYEATVTLRVTGPILRRVEDVLRGATALQGELAGGVLVKVVEVTLEGETRKDRGLDPEVAEAIRRSEEADRRWAARWSERTNNLEV